MTTKENEILELYKALNKVHEKLIAEQKAIIKEQEKIIIELSLKNELLNPPSYKTLFGRI